jgi:uncharacterized OsmC-like protein
MAKSPAQGGPIALVKKPENEDPIFQRRANPLSVRTLRCRTVAQGRFTQLNYIRDLPPQPVIEVEPEVLATESMAPSASEALLAAFGSCLAVGIHANSVAQNIQVHSLEVELEADIKPGSWSASEQQTQTTGFESIRVFVRLDADAPRTVLEALVEHATLWSPVANTLHSPVHLDVSLI